MRYAVLLAMPALAGCAAIRKADAPVTMRLSPAFAVVASGAGAMGGGSIAVAPVQARGVAGDRRYAYVEAASPSEVKQAATFFWEEPPPRVIERALVSALRGRYAQVYGPDIGLAAERRVIATIVRFEETGAGGASEAMVAIEAAISRGGAVERSGLYCGRAGIADASGTTRARAFEAAIAAAVGDFVQARASGGC